MLSPLQMRTKMDRGEIATLLLKPEGDTPNYASTTPHSPAPPEEKQVIGSFQRAEISGGDNAIVAYFTFPCAERIEGMVANATRLRLESTGVDYLVVDFRERTYMGRFDGYSMNLGR